MIVPIRSNVPFAGLIVRIGLEIDKPVRDVPARAFARREGLLHRYWPRRANWLRSAIWNKTSLGSTMAPSFTFFSTITPSMGGLDFELGPRLVILGVCFPLANVIGLAIDGLHFVLGEAPRAERPFGSRLRNHVGFYVALGLKKPSSWRPPLGSRLFIGPLSTFSSDASLEMASTSSLFFFSYFLAPGRRPETSPLWT